MKTEKTLVEKERNELFDECDMLRKQVEELINENKINIKSKKLAYKILYILTIVPFLIS